MIKDSVMVENIGVDISEYYQTPLTSLTLPDNYEKLIKRIMGLNGFNNSLGETFSVETVGDIVDLEPYQFSKCQGVGKQYVDMLIDFKKALPCLLNKLKQEPNTVFIDDIFTSTDNSYDFATPINRLALSPKYQKLIKRILVVMDNIKTVQDIIDIDAAGFSKLPYVGKSYVDLLIALQNTLAPTNIIQLNSNIKEIEAELPPPITLSTDQLEIPLNQLALPTQYQRLIKRISTAIGNVSTAQDIIDIEPINFSKLPAVGKWRIQLINATPSKSSILSILREAISQNTSHGVL